MTAGRFRAGCLIAFTLPFFAIGLAALAFVARLYAAADTPPAHLFVFAAVGFAFTVTAFGLIFAVMWGWREEARRRAQPANRILDESPAHTVMLWFVSIVWNAVASPALVLLPKIIREGHYAAAFGLIFPIVGLGLLVAAIRGTMRAVRFRRSTLVLSHAPVLLGSTLRGYIEVPYAPLVEATSILARLRAVERRQSGRSTTEKIVWEGEQAIARGAVGRAPNGATIPIQIAIPVDAPPSSDITFTRTLWRLTVEAAVPGVDYSAVFEVPVVRPAVPPDR
jgi:hypothetical protein